jgi:hypothetical protein
MNNFSFNEDGYPRIYTIHSQKGGVGKTSIALALAGMSAARDKKTLIIDGDMTGASIADIPGMTCEMSNNFNKLILAKPNEFCQLTKMWPSLIEGECSELELNFCRKVIGHDSVYFIPSSTGATDVETIVPLISQEDHLHFFRHRIEDILAAAIRSEFETIVLDHSPGMFGFSKTALQMCLEWGLEEDKNDHRLRHLLKGKWPEPSLQALLISSFEPHDYKAVLTSFQHLIDGFKKDNGEYPKELAGNFRFVFNKAKKVSDSVEELDKMFGIIGELSPYLKETIRDHEKEFGPQLAPLIEGFDMGDIFSNAEAFVIGALSDEWGKWFRTLAYRASLIKANNIHVTGMVG